MSKKDDRPQKCEYDGSIKMTEHCQLAKILKSSD